MKKHYLWRMLCMAVCAFMPFGMQGQTHTNVDWKSDFITPLYGDPVASAADGSGNVYVLSNGAVSAKNVDIVLTKLSSSGSTVWQKNYSSANRNPDYGVNLLISSSGNIIVTGVLDGGTSDDDLCLLSYSSSGTLNWAATWDGSASGDDVPVDLKEGAGGQLYVLASTVETSAQEDITVLCYTSSGTPQWQEEYDRNGLPDFPAGMSILPSNKLLVVGASSATAGSWQYTYLRLDSASGAVDSTVIDTFSLSIQDRPGRAIADADGNVYLTGRKLVSGTDFDIVTMKVKSDLSVDWTASFDAGDDDMGNALCLDDSGNVYVTGRAENSAGGNDLVILKYDDEGDLEWLRQRHAGYLAQVCEGNAITILNDRVAVSGYVMQDGAEKLVNLILNQDGSSEFGTITALDAYTHSRGKTLTPISDTEFAIAGTAENSSGTYRTFAMQFSNFHPTDSVESDTSGAEWMAGQLIVRFDTSVVDTGTLNNLETQWGRLGDFIDDLDAEDIINELDQRSSNVTVTRIFPYRTAENPDFLSRGGRTVSSPPLHCMMLIHLPVSVDLDTAMMAFSEFFPDVHYAERNLIIEFQSTPNDPNYSGDQYSLHPHSTYPTGDIEVEAAWDIQTGNANIRVGVHDTGIDATHPDFKPGIDQYPHPFSGILSSGMDQDYNGHGTNCAGIIGAVRNNSIGIAGIAGGDANGGTDGCTLVGHIQSNVPSESVTSLLSSIEFGSRPLSETGSGLHILSSSAGAIHTANNSVHHSVWETLNMARNADLVYVQAVGQSATPSSFVITPADANEELVIAVAASGYDGEKAGPGNGFPGEHSKFGEEVDICAPGVKQVLTLIPDNFCYTTRATIEGGGYTTFNGTSCATPHVAGVAALVLSEMYPFSGPGDAPFAYDIERLLEHHAEDKDVSGWDQYTGFGLVNAANTIEGIEQPYYQFLHFTGSSSPTVVSTTTYNSGVRLLHPYAPFAHNVDGISPDYAAIAYEVEIDIPYSIPSGSTILDEWGIGILSNLWGPPVQSSGSEWVIDPTTFAEVVSVNTSTQEATVRGWYYEIDDGNTTQNVPIGSSSGAELAYTLYIYDGNATSVEEVVVKPNLILFPNPAGNEFCIRGRWSNNADGDLDYQIINSSGQVIQIGNFSAKGGRFEAYIEVSQLPAGIYQVLIVKGDESIAKRIAIVR